MAERVVIVTGAARGIGLACARRFAADNYRVVMADRDEDRVKSALIDLALDPAQGIAIYCDVSDKLSVHNLLAETLSSFGQIDCVINNAGIAKPGGALDLSESDFDEVLSVNLRGAFMVSKYVAKYFVQTLNEDDDRSGLHDPNFSIINMSSVNAQLAIPNYLAYCVSKGGMNQLTKAMALELAPYGIRVNAIGPGSVKTDMLGSVIGNSEAMNKIRARTPLGRVAQPEEIASVAAFLASENASYVTGECLYADGGRLGLNYTMPIKDDDEQA